MRASAARFDQPDLFRRHSYPSQLSWHASYRLATVSLQLFRSPSTNGDEVRQLNSELPSFDGVSLWRNGPAPDIESLSDKPVLVHFFSVGCPLCREGVSAIDAWRERFAPRGLIVVGAFQPRRDIASTLADAERECDEHVRPAHACAVDLGGLLAARFGNEWPPAYYVYDRRHRLRHYQAGNWNLDTIETVIATCI